jgi:hypothetical protein
MGGLLVVVIEVEAKQKIERRQRKSILCARTDIHVMDDSLAVTGTISAATFITTAVERLGLDLLFPSVTHFAIVQHAFSPRNRANTDKH